jgi:hypothetical protein
MSLGAEVTFSANAVAGTSASVISAVSSFTNFIFPPYPDEKTVLASEKKLQILNGYPKTIAFLYLVLDNWPDKSGLGSRKKANAWADIHISRFGYHPDIQNEIRENFGQSRTTFRGHVTILKNGYQTFLGVSKSLGMLEIHEFL